MMGKSLLGKWGIHQETGLGRLALIPDRRETVSQRRLGGSRGPVKGRRCHHQRIATRPISPGQGLLVIVGKTAQLDGLQRNGEG